MLPFNQIAVSTALLCFSALAAGGTSQGDPATQLRNQAAQFPKRVIEVAPDVYTAVGYSPSNVSMVIGPNGVVIIDTGLDTVQAAEIKAAFRTITSKPVSAIILTHSHGDHTGGVSVFKESNSVDVWGRQNFGTENEPFNSAGLTYQTVRGARQSGFKLPPSQRINNGIAPLLYPSKGGAAYISNEAAKPTQHFKTPEKNLEIAGLDLKLVAAPGESDDELYVWLPRQSVLFSGDNFYHSFPNLYAIRGTPDRNINDWVKSLDQLLAVNASHLVPGHTLPIDGAQEIKAVLTDYRDAIKFVHDKTVEGMNQGLTPDALVEYVKLPENLANKDYLQPYYGNIEWGVRSIFSSYFGWFDGNATNLFRLTPTETASRMRDLAGGTDNLINAARDALAEGDAQWAAVLADHLIALHLEEGRALKAAALRNLAAHQVNATARNYYLTVAQELDSQK